VKGCDITDAAHVRGQIVNVAYAFDRSGAISEFSEIKNEELIGRGGLIFRFLYVHATDPIPLGL
jgi:hypothetical protein